MECAFLEKWQQLARKGSVYQSFEWAETVEKGEGLKPLIVHYPEEGSPKAIMLLFESFVKLPLVGAKKILVSEGSPLFSEEEDFYGLMESLKEKSKEFFYVKITSDALNPLKEMFKKSGFNSENANTFVLDTSKPLNEIFNNLQRDKKRRIKKAEAAGITVESCSESEIPSFYNAYLRSCEDGGINPLPLKFFKEFYNNMVKKGKGEIFVAKVKDKILSGVLAPYSNNVLFVKLNGSTEEDKEYHSNNFLFWKIIEFCNSKGIKHMDFAGYDLAAKEGDKTFSINQFKQSWGGEILDQPIYSNSKKYFMMRQALVKSKFLKRIYFKK